MPLYRIQKVSPDGIWSSVGMEFATLDDARRAKVRDAADQYRIVQVKTYVLLSIPNDPDDDPPARYIKLIPELHDADILTCNEVEEVVPATLGVE